MAITIKDVANAASVSDTTVSFVLKDDPRVTDYTKKIVLDKIQELGYRPHKIAKGLRLSRTNILALFLPEIGNQFVKEIFKGVEDYATQKGYNIIISTTHYEDEKRTERFLDQLGHGLVDGLIFLPIPAQDCSEEISRIKEWIEEKIPLVLIDMYFNEVETNFVVTNNIEGGYMATKHLIQQGHKSIAFISDIPSSSVSDRFEGYKKALNEHGVLLDNKLIVNNEFSAEKLGLDGMKKAGYESMKKLLTLPYTILPTAIFGVNDIIAIGAFNAIKDAGLRVPEDFALVGYDGSEYLEVSLTSVRQPLRLMGEIASRILIEEIENGNGKKKGFRKVYLKSELVVRDSSLSISKQIK